MSKSASDIARRLAREAEAVCRHYLSNGRKRGRYWIVGDVENTPGRSLYVHLTGSDYGKGAAGKWTDAATGEHGDLLDLISANIRPASLGDAVDEARRFLSLPKFDLPGRKAQPNAPPGSPEAARRLWAMSQPIGGTRVERYLAARGIVGIRNASALRFHPRCYYRPDPHSATETWPALIAAVTNLDGNITGAHRTWLDPGGFSERMLGKAPVETPRRAMGNLLGNAIRFGTAQDVLVAGEGIETMLSLKLILPHMPMAAALSATHLAAIRFSGTLRRLYIAQDDDPAGKGATETLSERACEVGIEAITLSPSLGDFNEDLRRLGKDALRNHLRTQIAPEDVARFMLTNASVGREAVQG